MTIEIEFTIKLFVFTHQKYKLELQHPETIGATNYQVHIMKITYTKDEIIVVMKDYIATLIDVEIQDVDISNYGNDFITVTCTKKQKVYETEPSYQTPL